MNLRDFVASLDAADREYFARLSLTTPNHLLQLTGGWRRASSRMALRMVNASRIMFPKRSRRWLTLDEMLNEAELIYRGPRPKQAADAEADPKPKPRKRAKKTRAEGVPA